MKLAKNTFSANWLESLTDESLEALRSDTAKALRRVPAEQKHHKAVMLGLTELNRERRLRRL